MLKKFMRKYHSPLKLSPFIMLFMFLIIIVLLYTTMKDNETSHEYLTILETQQKEKEWENLKRVIQNADEITRLESRNLALKIEHELRDNYVDMSQLKEQFESKQFNVDFHNTLRSHIIKDEWGYVFSPTLSVVGTEEYIISTFSPSKTHKIQKINSNKPIMWEELYLTDPNPKLTQQAVKAILERDKRIVFTQNGLKYGTIDQMDMSSLKDQFMLHGLKAMEEISIIAPAYITEQGDIFGVNDRTLLKKEKNHKLVIVQYVPLQKLITERYPVIKANEKEFEILRAAINADNTNRMAVTIFVCIVFMLLILYQMALYNTENQ